MLKKVITFFVYSNLFIALCAVLMVNQTCQLLLQEQPDWHFLGFVFFSTVCSYSFHWYLSSHYSMPTPRLVWMKRNHHFHLILFVIGLVGSAIFFYYLLPHWHWLLVSAVVTFLYSAPKIPHKYFRALRKVALGKTIFLAFVWMYVTTILPIVITDHEWNSDFTLFVISRFFLIYSICILFDYRDRQDDKAAGIRSLITYLDEKDILTLFIFSLTTFAVTTILMYDYGYNLASVTLLLIPGFITGLLYNYARRHFSDMFYYLVLDGLMALSAVLMLIPGI